MNIMNIMSIMNIMNHNVNRVQHNGMVINRFYWVVPIGQYIILMIEFSLPRLLGNPISEWTLSRLTPALLPCPAEPKLKIDPTSDNSPRRLPWSDPV